MKDQNGKIVSVDLETLEKSFLDAKSNLDAVLKSTGSARKGEDAEILEKAKKDADGNDIEDEDEDAEVDGEAEEEDDEEAEGVKKSLEDMIGEDEQAEAAMDVEPFLRQLVKGIDAKFSAVEAEIEKSIKLSKAQAVLLSVNSDLQKSISDTIEKIGGEPLESGSILRKGLNRFEADPKDKDKSPAGDKKVVMEKAMALLKAGKFQPQDVIKIEGRLNKGLALESKHIDMLEIEEAK